ncbi:hypothetical protein DFH09DRAFT_1160869 [Mycena vulgaris]|nr:hypothetical protein DFH09DRAFT_1160869 [Mycena vulgaris]
MADDGERGCLTSGIVRAELYAILEREDPSIALSTDWLDEGFRNVIESPSVLGFMVKQSTLTYFLGGVTGPGLVNWPKVKKHTLRHWQSLPRDLPSVLKGPDTTAILVTPEAFNFEATDGLFIKVNGPQKEVTLVSIRVALAQSHKDYDSDLAFYSRWPAWEKYFAGYTLKTAFLWVVDDEPLRLNFLKEAQSREGTREWPAHEEHFIALKTIAPRVGESLEWAREREQSRISSQTTV